jgi:hypothetical protein
MRKSIPLHTGEGAIRGASPQGLPATGVNDLGAQGPGEDGAGAGSNKRPLRPRAVAGHADLPPPISPSCLGRPTPKAVVPMPLGATRSWCGKDG